MDRENIKKMTLLAIKENGIMIKSVEKVYKNIKIMKYIKVRF